ncbi:Uncharacterized protein SAPIO_CDS2934 [Scedosporium apiospermum]|uniref:Chloride channel protein 3 n=1 Tax=Pseudallescheria apiosperma TaxID=563466 RepID=A0A084GBV6_PSEDA|nr:Uncharacterized protein SAPIO_CDS2934 [Scedosporium apiospermum]KEZ44818.1 Uncharacterized protein SAPIO_CDS2934 [Scedosporium apiospermum]
MEESNHGASVPTSPIAQRRQHTRNLHRHNSSGDTEQTPLLTVTRSRRLQSGYVSPRQNSAHPTFTRNQSYAGKTYEPNNLDQVAARLIQALSDRQESTNETKSTGYADERVWYDQFTSTDWVHDNIADAHRVKALRSRRDLWGRIFATWDASQGWILSALSGFLIAVAAYIVNVSESTAFDWKDGYCTKGFFISEAKCCPHGPCTAWRTWSEALRAHPFGELWTEFAIYLALAIFFSCAACALTLTTKTIVPSAYQLSTLDENLAADSPPRMANSDEVHSPRQVIEAKESPPMVYYSAAGSGVAEVRVILSGFVLHGFLGLKTLLVKTAALIFAVASGLSLGKEGPYVHIAACVGNIACRLFSKYDHNDAKRREVLSAAASAGVAVAFGAPLGGVLFGLEEVSYYFPAKTLFRSFFCCIIACLTLKFLNPYGTHKIVMFQVRYSVDWEWFELGSFIMVGIICGAVGAFFIKASKYWAKSFRRIKIIKNYPMLEVALVALVTGLMSYWNVFTHLPVAKLLLNAAAPCDPDDADRDQLGLCPSRIEEIPPVVASLFAAFLIKGFLTTITFGIKVPAGIYMPSMVVGGLLGRLIGHMVQWVVFRFPDVPIWAACARSGEGTCIQPGVYGLIAAGSMMCGVTRLSLTLAVILFELTGSLDYVLPFSLAILVAKWTADGIEPNSIYDLLTNMNSYPFLDIKHKPIFTSDLATIVPRVRRERVIDITNSPLVPATDLRSKLTVLHRAGELDGGLPILRNDVLVGLIPAPDLEYALDNLPDEETSLCLMANVPRIDEDDGEVDPTDFTPYIDPAPVALDIHSPMDLVYECFSKLGLRYICVLRDGKYAGMTHKKSFVKYMRELLQEQHGGS